MTTPQTVACTRCGQERPGLTRAPFRSPLGERILARICGVCWAEWLQHQTLLINHHGLDPREASSREFLYGQIETVLLGEGDEKAAEIDTSLQGKVGWNGDEGSEP